MLTTKRISPGQPSAVPQDTPEMSSEESKIVSTARKIFDIPKLSQEEERACQEKLRNRPCYEYVIPIASGVASLVLFYGYQYLFKWPGSTALLNNP